MVDAPCAPPEQPALFAPDYHYEIVEARRQVESLTTSATALDPLTTVLFESALRVAEVTLPDDWRSLINPFLVNVLSPAQRRCLVSPLPPEAAWYPIDAHKARRRLITLITQGLALEGPLFTDKNEAEQFVDTLLSLFPSAESQLFTSVKPLSQQNIAAAVELVGRLQIVSTAAGQRLFAKGLAPQEGLVFINPERVTLIWFMGL